MNSSYNYADFIGLNLDYYEDRKARKKDRLKKHHHNESTTKPEKTKGYFKTHKSSE